LAVWLTVQTPLITPSVAAIVLALAVVLHDAVELNSRQQRRWSYLLACSHDPRVRRPQPLTGVGGSLAQLGPNLSFELVGAVAPLLDPIGERERPPAAVWREALPNTKPPRLRGLCCTRLLWAILGSNRSP